MNLLTAASELTAYAVDHPFDPTTFIPPTDEYWREFTFLEKKVKVCFTRLAYPLLPDLHAWILSIYSVDPPPPALLEHQLCTEIAYAFFKEEIPQNEELDVIKMSRKYLKIERV